MAKGIDDKFTEANAKALVDLLLDPDTPDNLSVNIITHLISAQKNQNWFKTIMEEKLSFGECPKCNFKTHWTIPEDELNKMGHVSHIEDPRVLENTNRENCKTYEEACKKKKVVVL